MSKTENSNIEKTESLNAYDAATKLLSDPRAKLTGKLRRDLTAARIVFASLSTSAVEDGKSRASKRRIQKATTLAAKPTDKVPETDTDRDPVARKMAQKNLHQLHNSLVRGNRRAVGFAIKAQNHPQEKARLHLRALSRAYQRAAVAAQTELTKRTTPKTAPV